MKNDHRYLPAIAISNGAKRVYYIKAKHIKRKFGVSKYNTIPKMIFGLPELIFFLLRLKFGFYKKYVFVLFFEKTLFDKKVLFLVFV